MKNASFTLNIGQIEFYFIKKSNGHDSFTKMGFNLSKVWFIFENYRAK